MKTARPIYVGADHGGYPLKEQITSWLQKSGYRVKDEGALTLDPEDDFPVFAFGVGEQVAKKPTTNLGILLCRSGGGMAIAANKVRGVRAVECKDVRAAKHARHHDHANVLVLSGDWLTLAQAKAIIRAWLTTPYGPEPRRLRRMRQISAYEKKQRP